MFGVAHREFRPFQNRDAGLLFDAILGQGRRVYHTGGYLGDGEKVWLMAKLDKTLRIADNDIVELYALMANSHDGSMAFHIRLTTVRVVCQNTLSLALRRAWVLRSHARIKVHSPHTQLPHRISSSPPCSNWIRWQRSSLN
ncbi:MAG: DUF932 domain-containing protein [Flavobacteriales bacterium]|nr:DUF932 domain-containing protein [Flavobacteriales bacterium]